MSEQKTEKEKKRSIKGSDLKKAMRIFSYVRPYRWMFALGFFFLILTSLASLAFPKFTSHLFNSTPDTLTRDMMILVGLLVVQAAAGFFRIMIFVNVMAKSLAEIRKEVYQKMIQLPMTFFSERRVGELNSRVASDTAQIQETLTSTLAEFFRQVVMIFGGITILAVSSVKLTIFIVAVLPTVMLIAVFFGRFVRKYSKQVQQEVADSNTIVEETLQGIQSVKSYVNEWFEIRRYGKKIDDVAKTTIKGGLYRASMASFIILGVFGAIVAIIWFAVRMIHAGELEPGQLTEFVLYAMFIGGSSAGLANVYASIQKTIGATEDLFEILDEPTEEVQTTRPEKLSSFNGGIEFKNVEFSYPTRKETTVLKGVSFKANPGEQVALVGISGAGKSTITQLISRFYKPNSGTIEFDGKPAEEFKLSELRNEMALVPQEVLLFGGTIKENIEYGNPGASLEEIIEAAKKANAHEFIDQFPEGYETLVGERGVQLSGGQRQRVAIARAVLKDPKILLLDEATSSLDSESEKLVQEALETLMKGRTSVVIAHRLSTIKNADQILVLKEGEIVERGNHKELRRKETGLYQQLSSNQFLD
ncbi:MAG: ABC transporter transmembrane domain-containing protein [Schleiferiaceae bacterium]|jgi:ABC transporter fused permease/ATP-binding protein|nr:ABC transporter transmembrane domain-containing protein [Schleiferiaceae bacterium]